MGVVDFDKCILRANVIFTLADFGDWVGSADMVNPKAGPDDGLIADRAVDHTDGQNGCVAALTAGQAQLRGPDMAVGTHLGRALGEAVEGDIWPRFLNSFRMVIFWRFWPLNGVERALREAH